MRKTTTQDYAREMMYHVQATHTHLWGIKIYVKGLLHLFSKPLESGGHGWTVCVCMCVCV